MTGSIRRLAPETASRIAAGEVIDRPLSALKEILENALDAGAKSIEVRVDGALDRAFQVADDGAGIATDELALALERHATSKLQALEDLDGLATLGFRGEALPSIAAVSKLKIASRSGDAPGATWIEVAGGQPTGRGSIGRAPGTTVEVAELFFNVPARKKFLNTGAGELRAAIRMLECYALAFPNVGIRLVVDGRQRFDWPAVGSANGDGALDPKALRERAAALWGARHAEQLLAAEGERDGTRVIALLGLPEHARTTREGQVFLVNRRWIQNASLAHAVRQAYGNLLPSGRFPAAVVWLTVPPARLDVNVHPTKREVRFADDSSVFGLVAGACAKPLASLHPPFAVVRGGLATDPPWADRVRETPPSQTQLHLESEARAAAEPSSPGRPGLVGPAGDFQGTATPSSASIAEPELWQLHRTYILAPVRNGLVIIDQHAAHERILYEQARARLEGAVATAQQLLFPAIVDLSRSQFELVLEVGPWLQQLGWDLAPLGPPTVVIHGMPSEVRNDTPGTFLQDVLDMLTDRMGKAPNEDIVEQLARSYACHAAVRAGDPLDPVEMRSLVDRLFATERPHGDPHGRVTFVRLDLDELHRRFGRT